MRRARVMWTSAALTVLLGCAAAPPPVPGVPVLVSRTEIRRATERTSPASLVVASSQLVLVTTATWDTTAGELRRYERASAGAEWRAVGSVVPVVVGRTGLAWDDRFDASANTPVKREGDGRAPAGLFPLDTVFGFSPARDAAWVRMPYAPLTDGSECVDDVASAHYNTIVDRAGVPRIDWASAEHMRAIGQYALGVTVGYNAPAPRAGRGSCIFLHIWAGPGTYTSGCTAMPEHDLRDLVLWLDRARRPALVQLPRAEYARLRGTWSLP